MRRLTWIVALALCGACGGDGSPDGGLDGGDAGAATDAGIATDAGSRDGGPEDAGGDAGADAGFEDAGTTDAGSMDAGSMDAGDAGSIAGDSGTDGGVSDDGGTDAGPAMCTVATAMLGIPADSVGDPKVAHHPDGVSLIVWNDLERGRTFAILRRDNGTVMDLGDIGGYSLVGTDLARPFGSPAVLARSGGFTVVWQETFQDTGGFTQYRFRERSVATSGTALADSTTTPALRTSFTDVSPRLFDVGADLLVFRGRTSDAIPEERTVFRSTLGGWSLAFGGPEQVAYDGTQIAIADREGDDLRIRLFAPDGTEGTPLVVARPVPSESNRLRIEATDDGWLIVDRNTVFTVSDAGVVGAALTVARVLSVERGNGELLLLGMDGMNRPVGTLVSEAGTLLVQRTLAEPALRVRIDAAAWTGTQWLSTYVDDPGLDQQAMLASFCEEDL
ncbi:MAG: hypothetical protein AB8I08_27290 [Sandaracinaceae bacterium]